MDEELENFIAKKIIKSIEEEFTDDLFGSFSTHTNTSNETLTLEKYQEMIYLLYPKLYYATATYCQKGQIYICKETEYNPKYIIFHPEDFEKIKKSMKERTLVHIKDESKKEILDRILKQHKKLIEIKIDDSVNNFQYLNYSYFNWNNNNQGES